MGGVKGGKEAFRKMVRNNFWRLWTPVVTTPPGPCSHPLLLTAAVIPSFPMQSSPLPDPYSHTLLLTHAVTPSSWSLKSSTPRDLCSNLLLLTPAVTSSSWHLQSSPRPGPCWMCDRNPRHLLVSSVTVIPSWSIQPLLLALAEGVIGTPRWICEGVW